MEQFNISAYSELNNVFLQKIRTKFKELNIDNDELLEDLKTESEKVKMVFVGQFSAGKSSIIKMLTGEDVAIGAKITTQKSTVYQWKGLEVIDTPGIHTELRADHDTITYKQINKAALLVYVISNEGFSQHIGENFRKLAIDQQRANNMVLVVNKMDRSPLGNVPEQQQVIEQDLEKVTNPYKPKELYLSFLDTNSYFESLDEEDEELKAELLKASGYEVFIENLNRFVEEHALIGAVTKPLYHVRDVLTTIRDANNVIGDTDIADLEKTIRERRKLLIQGKENCQRAVRDIVRTCREQIKLTGREGVGEAINSKNQLEADNKIADINAKIEYLIIKCQDEVDEKIKNSLEALGEDIREYDNSVFVKSVSVNIRERLSETPINSRGLVVKAMGMVAQRAKEAENPALEAVAKPGAAALAAGKAADMAVMAVCPELAAGAQAVGGIGGFITKLFTPEPTIWEKGAAFMGRNAGKIVGAGAAVFALWAEVKSNEEQQKLEQERQKQKAELAQKYSDYSDDFQQKIMEEANKLIEVNISPAIKVQDDELANIEEAKVHGEKVNKELGALLSEVNDIIRKLKV